MCTACVLHVRPVSSNRIISYEPVPRWSAASDKTLLVPTLEKESDQLHTLCTCVCDERKCQLPDSYFKPMYACILYHQHIVQCVACKCGSSTSSFSCTCSNYFLIMILLETCG